MNILWVFLGGGIGACMRYGLTTGVKTQFAQLPIFGATLIVNIIACLAFALSLQFLKDKTSESLQLFLLVGLCGGFSTFSTFSNENLNLFRTADYLGFCLNVLLSVGLCLASFLAFAPKLKG